MSRRVGLVTIVVRDYDEAIRYYTEVLGFELVEDTVLDAAGKRWVVVAPDSSGHTHLLLARAVGPSQADRVGDQTGGRVAFFLTTDDFWRDYHEYLERGVRFTREPRSEPYGTVAVFRDVYGNLWTWSNPTQQRRSPVVETRHFKATFTVRPLVSKSSLPSRASQPIAISVISVG